MLTLPTSVKVYLAVDPVSMHLSFDRLSGMVKRLGLDPMTGHLFVFINRPKPHMKVLFYDRSGFCQIYKGKNAHVPLPGQEDRPRRSFPARSRNPDVPLP